MKLGVKVGHWVSEDYVKEMSKYVDFFEIYTTVGYEFDFLREINKLYTVHIPHFWSDKINFANSKREKVNLEALRWAQHIADKFDSDKIVFHPEIIEDENCSLNVLIDFIHRNYDSRLLVETMPYSTKGFTHICGDVDELRMVVDKTKIGFCLDFSHVAEYAMKKDIDFELCLKNLLSLRPTYFHITDSDLKRVFIDNYMGKHFNFFEGNMDIELCKKYLPLDAWTLLETPPDIEKQKREIEFLRR